MDTSLCTVGLHGARGVYVALARDKIHSGLFTSRHSCISLSALRVSACCH